MIGFKQEFNFNFNSLVREMAKQPGDQLGSERSIESPSLDKTFNTPSCTSLKSFLEVRESHLTFSVVALGSSYTIANPIDNTPGQP